MENTWICTDSDANQYGRKITDTIFEFKEFNHFDYSINTVDYTDKETFIDAIWHNSVFWVAATIDLSEYTDEEINEAINSYGYDEAENWIKAECLFEINFTDYL